MRRSRMGGNGLEYSEKELFQMHIIYAIISAALSAPVTAWLLYGLASLTSYDFDHAAFPIVITVVCGGMVTYLGIGGIITYIRYYGANATSRGAQSQPRIVVTSLGGPCQLCKPVSAIRAQQGGDRGRNGKPRSE